MFATGVTVRLGRADHWCSEGMAGMARAMGAISRGAQKREKKKEKNQILVKNCAPKW